MRKVVLVVEDRVHLAEEWLLYIQSVLFQSSLDALNNAPQNNDTELCILNVLWDYKSNDYINMEQDRFNEISQKLKLRQYNWKAENVVIPDLEYKYERIVLDEKEYIENRSKCADKVLAKINEIKEDRDAVVLLDLTLNDKKDTEIVLKGDAEDLVLSQSLYKSLSQICIPYTIYDRDGRRFREIWRESVSYQKEELYDKNRLSGNYINTDFFEDVCEKLKIGGDINE